MVWLSRVDTNIHAAFRVERYAIQDDPQETEDLALALAPASWAKLGSTLAPFQVFNKLFSFFGRSLGSIDTSETWGYNTLPQTGIARRSVNGTSQTNKQLAANAFIWCFAFGQGTILSSLSIHSHVSNFIKGGPMAFLFFNDR
jgi:hypothetical protein